MGVWFLACFRRALEAARAATQCARDAARFWQQHRETPLNERQRKVLYRVLGAFEGNLNLRKYIALTNASRPTAQRDLAELVDRDVFEQHGAGRATHYTLVG